MAAIVDQDKIDKLRKLLERPRTIEYLSDKLDRTPRTIHRWFTVLGEDGDKVVKELGAPGRYYLSG